MKILFISNDQTIFDSTSTTRARMRSYAAAIGELHIISPANRDTRNEQEGNLFLYPVHVWKFGRIHALATQARALIHAHGIEVVSAQDPFEHGLAALRAVRGTKAKLHIQVHTDFLSPWFIRGGGWHVSRICASVLNRYRRRIAEHVLPASAGIRTVSNRVKTSIVARYGSRISEPSVLPIWVDAAVPSRVRLPEHSFTFTLIAVGRLESEKRVEDILEALGLVIKQYPMIGLFIVGDGHERNRLERKVRSLALGGHVVFLGERSDARALMGSAQAFIQASAYEGYSRTLVEAALAKVPIITTDVGIVGDVFKKDKDVLSVPVADFTALSHRIMTIIEDNAMRRELSMHAEVTALAHLTVMSSLPERVRADLERLITHT